MSLRLKLGFFAPCFAIASCSNSSDFNSGNGSSLSSENASSVSVSSSESVPYNAIKKGSFTLWTNPLDPRPGEAYNVHLKVEVFDPSNSYSCRNLTGNLRGTDGFMFSVDRACQSQLGFEVRSLRGGPTKTSSFEYQFRIPGGSRRIVDTLNIQSRPLNANQSFASDSQTIEIEF
jgi:hypothetical protein